MNDFWQHCSALLERELTPQQYVTWIKPLALVDFDADASTLRIAAPNRFKLDWVKSQFSGRIADLARDFWHAPVDIQFVLDPKATARKAMGGASALSAASAPAAAPVSPSMQRAAAEPAERSNGGHANASAHINALAAEAAQHAQSLQHNDQADNGDLDLPSLDANEAAVARQRALTEPKARARPSPCGRWLWGPEQTGYRQACAKNLGPHQQYGRKTGFSPSRA